MRIEDFYNKHAGETCLICGVGGNLKLTPPQWFDYPSFGVNTIYKYEGWKPTYYVGVDERLEREDGAAISDIYRDVHKFIPFPDRDNWKGENFHRFYHRTGDVVVGGLFANRPNGLVSPGIGYRKIMDAVFQIAWYMGFTTMLTIGFEHKPYSEAEPDADRYHFWGVDEKAPAQQEPDYWFMGYKEVRAMMGSGVRVLNISQDTYVPEDVIPRGDWREWRNVHESIDA